MKVAVLGSGPAGLMACHAATLRGHVVRVYSKDERSRMGGAQYLHRQLPEVQGVRSGAITYLKMGCARGYARKVYNDANAPTSWEHFRVGDHMAYSLRDTYGQLWNKYHHHIEKREVQPLDIQQLAAEFDVVFCSVPAEVLCLDWQAHQFTSQRIVLTPHPALRAPNTVLYSGRDQDRWYRTSTIFGYSWTEFAAEGVQDLDLTHTVHGIKPLDTTCACHEHHDNFYRIGRYGQWKKGVLTHHAFEDVDEIMGDYERQEEMMAS